jgi:hypothetical protein
MGILFCKEIIWKTMLDYESDDDNKYWEREEKIYEKRYGKNSYQNQYSNQLPEQARCSFRF